MSVRPGVRLNGQATLAAAANLAVPGVESYRSAID
jgi:hypothetical protein